MGLIESISSLHAIKYRIFYVMYFCIEMCLPICSGMIHDAIIFKALMLLIFIDHLQKVYKTLKRSRYDLLLF